MQAGVIGAVAVKYLQIGWKRKVHRIDRVLVPLSLTGSLSYEWEQFAFYLRKAAIIYRQINATTVSHYLLAIASRNYGLEDVPSTVNQGTYSLSLSLSLISSLP